MVMSRHGRVIDVAKVLYVECLSHQAFEHFVLYVSLVLARFRLIRNLPKMTPSEVSREQIMI